MYLVFYASFEYVSGRERERYVKYLSIRKGKSLSFPSQIHDIAFFLYFLSKEKKGRRKKDR